MPNYVDYMKEYQTVTFQEHAFCELDALVLVEIGYLPMDNLVPSTMSGIKQISIQEFYANYQRQHQRHENWILHTKQRYQLLKLVALSKRFEHLMLYGYVNDVDEDREHQFSAVIFDSCDHLPVIAFRGTDDTLVGWKEDLKLLYLPTIPSQEKAVQYVERIFTTQPHRQWVFVGHSKGGNVAVFAASQLQEVQNQIIQIYCFDAPGFSRDVVSSLGYQKITNKVKAYRPQVAIVGMILHEELHPQTVYSTARKFAQHDTSSWQIQQGKFVTLPNVAIQGQLIQQTLQLWLSKLSVQEIEQLVEFGFEPFFKSDISSLVMFSSRFFSRIYALIDKSSQLDKQKKQLFVYGLQLLYFSWNEVRKTHGLSVLDVPFWYKGFKKRKRAKKVHITVQK